MKKILGLIILMAVVGSSSELSAMSRSAKYKSKTRHHSRIRRVYWNPVLKGSYESMLRQNEEIDRLELPRIQNDDELQNMILRQELVDIQETDSLRVATNLDTTRRFCRPWTREFLDDLSAAFYDEFKKPVQVNSAVRTVEQQKKLRRHNRNAAPIEGDTASSHLAGTTVDLAKRGLTRKQKKWLDAYLKNLQDQGLIEAAEERRQACYHIMVKSQYSAWRGASDAIAQEQTATIAQ
jgi:uncharacterized protein YcbK (DUF882 family)